MRHRSVERVASWVRKAMEQGYSYLRFVTPNAFAYLSEDNGRTANLDAISHLLREMAALVGKERVYFGTFPSEVGPETVTPEAVELVKRHCGNSNLLIGAQSGSDRLLQELHRRHSVAEVYRAVEVTIAGGLVPIVDVIFKAFGTVAASCGCMNNLTFGNERFGYYETIGGGAGAGEAFDGASGVHTHMTNTRITDPEILEQRYPVRLEQFALRQGSGGSGRHRGGDGLVREITFKAPMTLSLLSERRIYAPWGAEGGEAGKKGENILCRDGECKMLKNRERIEVQPGDTVMVKTPGGGGFGSKDGGEEG